MVTNINQLDLDKTYSYADYLLWQFRERVELLRGKLFKMSPAPGIRHQQISRKLFLDVGNYLSNSSCQVFSAPFDVALLDKEKSTPKDKIYTIVQPDICVVCDREKLADKQKCMGAPDFIIEILSPGNSNKEINLKYDLYEEAGVKEYWLVSPEQRMVNVYYLDKGKFIGIKPHGEEQVLHSILFPELGIDLKNVFSDLI